MRFADIVQRLSWTIGGDNMKKLDKLMDAVMGKVTKNVKKGGKKGGKKC